MTDYEWHLKALGIKTPEEITRMVNERQAKIRGGEDGEHGHTDRTGVQDTEVQDKAVQVQEVPDATQPIQP